MRPEAGELTDEQHAENVASVHAAWKLHFDDVRHSLAGGFYQGWDLHPAQLVSRYAAVYSFFLEGIDAAGVRLKNFVGKAAQATLVGDVFDDAATGSGTAQLLPARHQLRRDHRGGSADDDGAHRRRVPRSVVREDHARDGSDAQATRASWLDLVARWVHVIAGIMWVGNSLLFNWLDRNLRPHDGPRAVRHRGRSARSGCCTAAAFYYVEKTLLGGQTAAACRCTGSSGRRTRRG